MTYSIYGTETFEKEFNKLENKYKNPIKKIFSQLRQTPYVGDSIKYKFFREKRIKEFIILSTKNPPLFS